MGCASSTPARKPDGEEKGARKQETVLGKELKEVSDEFTLGKVLGRGQFGTTRLASGKDGETYACKSIAKRKLTCPDDIADVRREIEIMHHLKGHSNITFLKGAYEDRQAVHLVMDLCSGGELFDRISAKGKYSERDAAELIRTMVSVVAHCHSLGVIHRDLKPENFLLQTKADDAALKCTDFGLSVFFKPGESFNEVVGSAYYVAPEVLKRNYGPEADIWSCGVILYILLSGVPPFWGQTEQQIFDAILKSEKNGETIFDDEPWPSISEEAKDCVRRMLQPDQRKRATANEILQHPWMKENGVASSRPLDNVIHQRMKNFAQMNRFKREARAIIASALPAEEIAGLTALFRSIDADNSGTITAQELRDALRAKGSVLKPEDIEGLMAMIDADASGTIDYKEFLAATLSQHQLEKEETLMAAFNHFDKDRSGTISKDELREGLREGMAGNVPESEIEAILAEVDKDGDGTIDFQEFTAMISKSAASVPGSAVSSRGLTGYKAAMSAN